MITEVALQVQGFPFFLVCFRPEYRIIVFPEGTCYLDRANPSELTKYEIKLKMF